MSVGLDVVRARLQPCRKAHTTTAASAAEVRPCAQTVCARALDLRPSAQKNSGCCAPWIRLNHQVLERNSRAVQAGYKLLSPGRLRRNFAHRRARFLQQVLVNFAQVVYFRPVIRRMNQHFRFVFAMRHECAPLKKLAAMNSLCHLISFRQAERLRRQVTSRKKPLRTRASITHPIIAIGYIMYLMWCIQCRLQ